MARIDLTNKRFGRLVALSIDEEVTEYQKDRVKNGEIKKPVEYWTCRCDCGNYKTIAKPNLVHNKIKSCGCYNSYISKLTNTGRNGSIEKDRKDLIKFFVNKKDLKYGVNSNKKVLMRCPVCKNEKMFLISTLSKNGFSCPVCSDGFSYPEKFIYKLLKQIGVNFEYHKKFYWSENREYDFYLEEENTIIETHGIQHYEKSSRSDRTLEQEQKNDKLKEILAKENGIKTYIQLDCRKSEIGFIINSILGSDIKSLFDLSLIDWNDCESFIYNESVLKNCCDMINENKSVNEISKKLKISIDSVYRYVKRGKNIGLCNYKTQQEIREEKYKVIMKCYKDGIIYAKDISKFTNIDYQTVIKILKQGEINNECIYYKNKKTDKSIILEIYNKNKNVTLKQISLETGFSVSTVLKYLEDNSDYEKYKNKNTVICENNGKKYCSYSEAEIDLNLPKQTLCKIFYKNKSNKIIYKSLTFRKVG